MPGFEGDLEIEGGEVSDLPTYPISHVRRSNKLALQPQNAIVPVRDSY
jgi:hypothetical protein